MPNQHSELANVEAEEKALLAEYEARQDSEDRDLDEWLPEWFLGKKAAIDALRKASKEIQTERMAILDSAWNALVRRWGEEFKTIVDGDVKGSKRKSELYGVGKAGYRMRPATVQITDMDTALEWCAENCPEALDMKLTNKKPAADIIIGMIEAGGECPEGFEYHPAEDRFYPDLGGVSALPPKQKEE